MARVIIISDEQLFLDLIKYTLEKVTDYNTLNTFKSTGKRTINYICENCSKNDLILFDMKSKHIDGCIFLKKIRRKNTDTKILMLSDVPDSIIIERCMTAGANGFAQKNVSIHELIGGIKKMIKGEIYLCTKTNELTVKSSFQKSQQSTLTNRESEVLRYITEGFPNTKISRKLKVSTATVSFHRRNLMNKLNITNAVDLTKYAIKTGYCNIYNN